jgi:replicative DNA helicase
MEAEDGSTAPLAERLAAIGAGEAVQRIAEYGDRLLIHRSTGASTDVDQIREISLEVAARTGQPPLVIVDYLQKVAVKDHEGDEMELVTFIVEGLKDLALENDVPVVAIVAADKEGLVTGKRLRINNLRGSSALAYEPDVVLIMNEKYDVVARHHLVYDVGNAERFHNWAVITIEKNRSGPDRVDIEFMKRFDQGRFDVAGRRVNEQLVDERVFTE